MAISGAVQPCYDYRIMEEYRDVLMRPKFKFSRMQVDLLLDTFVMDGISVMADPLPDVAMNDEDDRAFFELHKKRTHVRNFLIVPKPEKVKDILFQVYILSLQ